jgi:hypothetical protein
MPALEGIMGMPHSLSSRATMLTTGPARLPLLWIHTRPGQPVVYWPIVGLTAGLCVAALGLLLFSLLPRVQPRGLPPALQVIVRTEPTSEATPVTLPVSDDPADGEEYNLEALCTVNETSENRTPSPVPSAPRAVAPAAAAPPPAKLVIKRLHDRSAEDLRKQLLQVPEIKANAVSSKARRQLANAPKDKKYRPEEMPDYAGLPLRMGVDCQLGKEPTEHLQALSKKLHALLGAAIPKGDSQAPPDAGLLRDRILSATDVEFNRWLTPDAVPTITQMLMVENQPLRLLLVEMLAANPSRPATLALAQRALYDLAFEVREAAIQALHERPREDYRTVLLDGLRYPWVPVADHAAEALAALRDREAVPALKMLLWETEPSAPFPAPDHGGLMVRELVRINHLSNCTLCHPQSRSTEDPVRGLVPVAGRSLTAAAMSSGYGGGCSPGTFIRADVTYLRQDFSLPQPVAQPGSWPAHQRYDYLVRTRPVLPKEWRSWRTQVASPAESAHVEKSEHREAIQFALRELAGRDEAPPMPLAQRVNPQAPRSPSPPGEKRSDGDSLAKHPEGG